MNEGIKIIENSWSYKLIKFVFDLNPKDIKNFCPYFWLIILGIILFPFKMISWPYQKYKEFRNKRNHLKFLRSLDKSQLYYLKYHPYCGDSSIEFFVRSTSWKVLGISDKEILDGALVAQNLTLEEVDRYREDWERKVKELTEKYEKSKKRAIILSNFTKQISKIWFILLIVVVGYIVTCCLANLAFLAINEPIATLRALLAFFVGIGIIVIPYLYVKSHFISIKLLKDKKIKSWKYIPLWIVTFPGLSVIYTLKFIWKGLIRTTGIFGEYLNAAYKDYCPGINWEEKK